MNKKRYYDLSRAPDELATLTEEEMKQGWHWCQDWDFMLVGPGMIEKLHCHCFASNAEVME